jgi:hypothetical protein
LGDPETRRPLRVLLTEGGSTSARQAITILGLAGHHVEICDPRPYCLGRFSRFVKLFHRCPAIGNDPVAYFAFVGTLLTERRFDVLLPIHEQGLLFARMRHRIEPRVAVALPEFADYRTALGKVHFSRLLDELALPQPRTRIVGSAQQLRDAAQMPCAIKTAFGTASRGVWLVRDEAALDDAIRELTGADGFAGELLVQDLVDGTVEHAQAVFCRGRLLGIHAYRQIGAGAGGGDAIKLSVGRPEVRAHLQAIGARLAWHGALSVDYIQTKEGAAPLYIDCNPRLVEPMSAWLAGANLLDLLLRVSLGEMPPPFADGRAGVRTHLAMQALLGCALRRGSRRDLWRESMRLLRRQPPYAESIEELTPPRLDWISALPLALTAAILLVAPRTAATLAAKGWGDHLLNARSIAMIESTSFD